MKHTEKIARNVQWGMINNVITMLMPFLTRTVLIYTMGIKYVGLGSLFTSVLEVFNFAELGIGRALVFSMYKPIAEQDDDKVCMLLRFYRKCYICIGVLISVCGLAVMPFLSYLVADTVPDGISLQILFSIYMLNNVLGYFMFAYYNSLFIANIRNDVTSKINAVLCLISNMMQMFLLMVLHNYYVYVLVIPVISFLNNICVRTLARKIFPQYTCRGRLNREEKLAIFPKIGGLLFQKIGVIVLNNVDSIVISAFLGLALLGTYNGYYTIIKALMGFLIIINNSAIPAFGNIAVTESKETNYFNFRKYTFLYMWVVTWMCSCLLVLYQPFIKMWQGEENMLTNFSMFLVVLNFMVSRMDGVSGTFKESIGLWWEGKFVYIVSSIVNLTLNIILVQFIGFSGVMISTIFSMVFISIPWGSWVLFKHYFVSIGKYVRYLFSLFLYGVKACVVWALTCFVCNLVHGESIVLLIERSVVCFTIPNIILFIMNLRNSELKPVISFIIHCMPDKFIPTFVVNWLQRG